MTDALTWQAITAMPARGVRIDADRVVEEVLSKARTPVAAAD